MTMSERSEEFLGVNFFLNEFEKRQILKKGFKFKETTLSV